MKTLFLKTLSLTILIIILSVAFASVSVAQTTKPPIIAPEIKSETLKLPHSKTDPNSAIKNEENYLMAVALPLMTRTIIAVSGGLAVLFVIVGGIQILTAYGQDEKIANAKKTIQYALIGLLISILSYAIVSIISAIRL
jgi:hypothetical protein